MPLYMDRHEVPEEATPLDIAEAHARDVEVQAKYGVDYITYWFDHQSGAGFCLVEGPSVEVVEEVHREAHGLMPSKVIEVDARHLDVQGECEDGPHGDQEDACADTHVSSFVGGCQILR